MSVECSKCGEYCLDCKCCGITFRPPDKLKDFLDKNSPAYCDEYYHFPDTILKHDESDTNL